jgi:uncharacterized membrane protein YczE
MQICANPNIWYAMTVEDMVGHLINGMGCVLELAANKAIYNVHTEALLEQLNEKEREAFQTITAIEVTARLGSPLMTPEKEEVSLSI